ncbi:MAG: vWA domain-containing protein [archaeon]
MKLFLRDNKKGYYFSLDAFIALLVLFSIVLVVKPPVNQVYFPEKIHEDLLTVLSSLKIGDIDNSYVMGLIASGEITNENLSVLEQIGEFYATSNPEAELLASAILNQINVSNNVGIYFNGMRIATKNDTSLDEADDIWTSRRLISGIQSGSSVTGYSARVYLSSSNKVNYYYFGGYIGDGNITLLIEGNVSSIEVEAVFSGDFDVLINGDFAGSYSPAPGIPYKFNINNMSESFIDGNNYLEFGSSENLYIAGGFVKVGYSNSGSVSSTNKRYLSGIDGLINLYDSIYVPGNLTQMEVYLHYNSNHSVFFTLGNETIYNWDSGGVEQEVIISNAELSGIFDYDLLDWQTVPFRFGLENSSYVINFSMDADVYSVTDLSGSMDAQCAQYNFFCCLISGMCSTPERCEYCGGVWENKIGAAKDANYVFIDDVLNGSENRVGLVGYNGIADPDWYHELSGDSDSLKAMVDFWDPFWSTCICCGINEAASKLVSDSTPNNFRSMVVMSDGAANVKCAQQGTGNAAQDAIQSACDAYEDYGIKVYSVGFGSEVDENTLQSIAACGQGSYYYGDVDDLVEIYRQIAEEILNASYSEQTLISEGLFTKLYPDSYISVSYDGELHYGLAITAETEDFGNTISEGTLFVPNDTIPLEVNVVSYSGSKWTSLVEVNNELLGNWDSVFNLSNYGTNYIYLGDPYLINIPTDKIDYGDNSFRISTALSSGGNFTGGSIYDKIIYTLIKEFGSYSPIVASAEGCIWLIEFEDGTNSTISIPPDYNGTGSCSYTSWSEPSYNSNDAIDLGVYGLLLKMDLNGNKKIETKFSEGDITFSSTEVSGIPFTWDTEAQMRVWR